MFIGHFGLAFASKKIARQPSLAVSFFAAQFIDLLWPFLILFGIESVSIDPGNTEFTPLDFESYPYSHSLLAVIIWSVLLAAIYFMVKKNSRAALIIGLLVASHWMLDWITHRPDLPLSFSEDVKVGLGLWNNKILTLVIEMIIFLGGVLLYTSATVAKNKTGRFSLWSLVIIFLLIYIMNVMGDPPPDARTIGFVGLAQLLFIPWGYWIDKNRKPR